jgi:hypothetical protein
MTIAPCQESAIVAEKRLHKEDGSCIYFFMIRRKIAQYLARKKFIIKILENPADLSEFKERPTPQLITGLILMVFSYVIGWPAVAALTFFAVRLREPLIAIIGGLTIYGLSYVVFIVGAWLARTPHYMGTLARYTIQFFLRKLLS